MRNHLFTLCLIISTSIHSQNDSLKINTFYDDISGVKRYMPSKKIDIKNEYNNMTIQFSGITWVNNGKLSISALTVDAKDFGCIDKPYMQLLFSDSIRFTLQSNEFNCKGMTILNIDKNQESVFRSKRLLKLKFVNNGEVVSGALDKDNQDYFIKLFQLADAFVTGQKIIEEPKKENTVYSVVEQMPEFVGGKYQLATYIDNKIRKFKMPKEAGMSGKCFLRFIVDIDGTIKDVTVLSGVPSCSKCDEEAIKVISEMPHWKAGKQNGKTVPVYYNQTITFHSR